MDTRKSTTQTTAPDVQGCDRAGDARPRYERPRIVKRRSVVRVTGSLASGTGPGTSPGPGLITTGTTP